MQSEDKSRLKTNSRINEDMATTSTSVVGSVTETTELERTEETSTLKLKLKKKQTKKITWTEDTVDNEGTDDILRLSLLIVVFVPGLGKKKSKCCCQFHSNRTHLDESSSEEEEEDHCCPGSSCH